MHTGCFLTIKLRTHRRAGIKWRIQHRFDLTGFVPLIGARFPADGPKAAGHPCLVGQRDCLCRAVCAKAEGSSQFRTVKPGRIVKARRTITCREPTPGPIAEILLQGPRAEIGVEVALALPLPTRPVYVDFDPRAWREGSPDVAAVLGQRQLYPGDSTVIDDHSSLSMHRWSPHQTILEGPTSNREAVWRKADVPRSVIVKRPPGPYVATLMQTWFWGFLRPDQRYHGEKTDPMKPITETARRPQSLRPSTYHHA